MARKCSTAPSGAARALRHRSFSADHNERLEFLGDAVLNLAVAALLYAQLATLPVLGGGAVVGEVRAAPVLHPSADRPG